MLVLSRHTSERIIIRANDGKEIVIQLVTVNASAQIAKIGIEADKEDFQIWREEIDPKRHPPLTLKGLLRK